MLKFLWILPLALLVPVSTATAGEAEVARVKAELPAAARRLDAMFSQVRGKARIRVERRYVSAKLPLTEARFAIDHGMEKVEIERFTPDAKAIKLAEKVYCVGQDTAFQLYRGDAAKDYDVKGIGTTPSDRSEYMSLFGEFVIAHHGVGGLPMTRVLADPGFAINGAEALEQDGKTLMRVECVMGPRDSLNQVSLVLDPDAGWLVRSCRIRPIRYPDDVSNLEIEYGPTHEGVPLPRLVTLDGPGGEVKHCEFTDWTFAPTPLSEFNMTHYGLPDLVKPHRRRNWLPYWLAGGAVVLGAVGFMLRRFASRGTRLSRA